MAEREWSGIKICTVPTCQHSLETDEEFHFIKALCITEPKGTPVLAFWGGVVCEKCFEEIKKLLPECRHDFETKEQIGQIFIDEINITGDPFANFCSRCFKNLLPELLKYLLPWNDFVTVAFFDKIRCLPT